MPASHTQGLPRRPEPGSCLIPGLPPRSPRPFPLSKTLTSAASTNPTPRLVSRKNSRKHWLGPWLQKLKGVGGGGQPGCSALPSRLTSLPPPLGPGERESPRVQCRRQGRHHGTALTFFISKLHLAHKKPENVINCPLEDMVLINYWVIQGDSCVRPNLPS